MFYASGAGGLAQFRSSAASNQTAEIPDQVRNDGMGVDALMRGCVDAMQESPTAHVMFYASGAGGLAQFRSSAARIQTAEIPDQVRNDGMGFGRIIGAIYLSRKILKQVQDDTELMVLHREGKRSLDALHLRCHPGRRPGISLHKRRKNKKRLGSPERGAVRHAVTD